MIQRQNEKPRRDFDALPDSALVDIFNVAALFDLSVSTINRLCRSGDLPRPVIIGRARRWNVGQLRAKLRAIGAEPPAPPPPARKTMKLKELEIAKRIATTN